MIRKNLKNRVSSKNFNRSLYESIMKDVTKIVKKNLNENSSLEREHWQIQYGPTDYDCEKVDVICNEEELEIICAALTRYDEKIRRRPIACVAQKGGNASFRQQSDYLYCDCM